MQESFDAYVAVFNAVTRRILEELNACLGLHCLIANRANRANRANGATGANLLKIPGRIG